MFFFTTCYLCNRRLFFRIKAANRDRAGALADDDEDEEELLWESEDAKEDSNKCIEENKGATLGKVGTNPATITNNGSDVVSQLRRQNQELQDENSKLQGQVRSLISRIAQLEEINSKLSTVAQGTAHHILTSPTADKTSSVNNKITSASSTGEFSETLSTSSDGSAVMIHSSTVPQGNSNIIEANEEEGKGSNSPIRKRSPANIDSSTVSSPAAVSSAHAAVERSAATPAQSSIPLIGLDEEEDDEWN
jgi:hypothetical protein